MTGRMTTAESNIASLTSADSTINSRIDGLATRTTTAEGDITALQNGLASKVDSTGEDERKTLAKKLPATHQPPLRSQDAAVNARVDQLVTRANTAETDIAGLKAVDATTSAALTEVTATANKGLKVCLERKWTDSFFVEPTAFPSRLPTAPWICMPTTAATW